MPVFDAKIALARLDNDADLFRELIGFYREDAPQLLNTIDLALNRGDLGAAQRAAHSLKGLSANFEARIAADAAARAEQAARQGDPSAARAAFEELRSEVDLLQAALAEFERQPS